MRSLLGITGLAALTGLLLVHATTARAQSFSRTLDEIRVTAAGGREVVLLTFSAPVEAVPAEDHQPGMFRLRFSATGSNVPNSIFQIRDDSTIQDYRVERNEYATTVAVNLRNPRANLQGRLRFETDGNQLRVVVPAAGAPAASDDDAALVQAERQLASELRGDAPASTQPGIASTALDDNWIGTLLTMIVALALVLGLLYALVWAYNRFLGHRLPGRGGQFPIRHLGSFAVGPRQRVVILDINGEVVACGVTPQNISFLTRLGVTRQAATQRKGAASGHTGGGAGAAAPATGAGAPTQSQAPAKGQDPEKDPVHTFAETLREKVRSLKRLK
jgi:flagellar biogenesis protein FliO